MNRNIIKVSVVIPCFNEEKTIASCIRKARQSLNKQALRGEVIVVDNNSTDNSARIAREAGAEVVFEKKQGYGSAYLRGLKEAQGEIIVIADGDGTYNFLNLNNFIKPLRHGFDFVCGSRLKGKILKGAMPWHHRYIGVPFLTFLVNFLFKTKMSDAHCGMRAFTKEAYKKMNLETLGMEFASEMIIEASVAKLKITETPITYYPREGKSKLHALRDGWRHLKFILISYLELKRSQR